MKIIETGLEGLKIIALEKYSDDRGYFLETYRQNVFAEHGINQEFVQDNEAMSNKGVLRGLHYQVAPHAQAKVVRIIRGAVFDVAVDIREDSETYGQWYGLKLSENNSRQLLIPRGFAHGYLVLEDKTVFTYKCDSYYAPEAEGGIAWNDPQIGIEWPAVEEDYILSDKDKNWPQLGAHKTSI